MPVGTYGSVKAMSPLELKEIDAQIILGNTFHLWLRPGNDIVSKVRRPARFMGWDKPILTDSGGFQVFSLGAMRKITEEGVHFASPINGDKLFLSPEVSMQIQRVLNSDIVMQFDECTPYEIDGRPATLDEAAKSMRMSLRWAQTLARRVRTAAKIRMRCSASSRAACSRTARRIAGRTGRDRFPRHGHRRPVGRRAQGRHDAHAGTRRPALPANKPHYLMGVGTPEDLVAGVAERRRHVRLRDADPQCRNGWLFTRFGDVKIKNARYKDDKSRWTAPAAATPAAIFRAPICIICTAPAKSWARA
jgi:queuine tRNA-ribosyltransferase